jgi:hypothetical protein
MRVLSAMMGGENEMDETVKTVREGLKEKEKKKVVFLFPMLFLFVYRFEQSFGGAFDS